MSFVIVGGGIIGISTAFYLLELGASPTDIHIVESAETPASAASGYAAGFLASNWYSSEVLPLGELSFKLHQSLADRFNGKVHWGYSGTTSISLSGGISRPGTIAESDAVTENGVDWLLQGISRSTLVDSTSRTQSMKSLLPPWLRVPPGAKVEILSREDSTAQVDPSRLCRFLLSHCQGKGVTVHTATQVVNVEAGQVKLSNGISLPCQHLAITCGPWTGEVLKTILPFSEKLLKSASYSHLGGHSIIVRSPHWSGESTEGKESIGCHAIFADSFTSSTNGNATTSFAPEFFSRLPNEIWMGGLNSLEGKLHSSSGSDPVIKQDSLDVLKEAVREFINIEETDELEIVRAGNCYRPVTSLGHAYITKIDESLIDAKERLDHNATKVWMSAGHGPWGIALSQGTGYVLAEMILGKTPSIDISAFSLKNKTRSD